MRLIAIALLALGFVLSSPALAAPDAHGKPDAHGTAGGHGADDGHGHGQGEAAGHGADAGHGDEHHYLYTADSDHDGTPNWMDPTEGAEPNSHFPLTKIGFHAVNFMIFLGLVVWKGRRPVQDALADRALAIKKELTDSARVRDEARQRSQELGDRLDRIEAEISGMREKAKEEAANEEKALISRAHTESERIAEAAQRSIRDEVTRARYALKRDAVNLAVELAESTLKERMNAEHQQRLARDFLDSIKTDGENRV